ncbi:MAG: thioesterase family protein [Rhodospirillales bacterium]|nr:thioesterase family protein [Rhodospirillales bacterium]
MNLIFRLIRVILAGLMAPPRTGGFSESVLDFRVWPTDLDVNLHMTNARYLSIFDLGRADLMVRHRTLRLFLKNGWRPMLGGATVRFRRPLAPLQKFRVISRVVGWDAKWFYMEHRIESHEGLVALALMRGVFYGRGGVEPPEKVMHALGHRGDSPPLPAVIQSWRELEMNVDQMLAE